MRKVDLFCHQDLKERQATLSENTQEENTHGYLLSKLVSAKKPGLNKTVMQQTLETPRTDDESIQVMMLDINKSLISLIIRYLTNEQLLDDKVEA